MSEQPTDTRLEPARSRNITRKQATTGVTLVVVIVFALINLQDVTMHWIIGTTHTPLIILVAVCVLIGVGAGFLLGRRKRSPAQQGSTDN